MRTLLSRVPPRSWPPWMSLVSAKLQVGPWWGGGPGCPSSARPGVVPVFGDRSSRGVCERAGGSSARAGSPRGRGIALRPVLGPRGRGPAPRIRRRQRELGSQDSSSCFPGVRSQRSCHLGRNRARSLKLPISSLPSWFTRDSRAACAARTASAANLVLRDSAGHLFGQAQELPRVGHRAPEGPKGVRRCHGPGGLARTGRTCRTR